MSQENVEAYRQGFAAVARGDAEAAAQGYDAGVVLRTDPIWPGGPFYGADAVRSFNEDLIATLGPVHFVIEELTDAGDRVIARLHVRYQGTQSGAEGDLRFTHVATYRDGKVILMENFLDHAQALQALGLRE
jgi:ketosteroid isomerase-like protein